LHGSRGCAIIRVRRRLPNRSDATLSFADTRQSTMVLADEQGTPEHPAHEPCLPLPPADLEQARRAAGLQPSADGRSPACSAPATELVLDRNGDMRGCTFGTGAACTGPFEDLAAAWHGPEFEQLRSRLQDGQLPHAHCGTCVRWWRMDLAPLTPMVRDHGKDQGDVAPPAPRSLVLRLPEPEAQWPAPTLAAALAALCTAEQVVLDETVFGRHPTTRALIDSLRTTEPRPRILVRCESFAADAASLLAELPIEEIEVLGETGLRQLPQADQLAKATGARLRLRFVLAPDQWFQFEAAARAAAAIGAWIDLRTMHRDGVVPLAGLAATELRLVKDVVGGCWTRCGGPDRPSSIPERDFDHLLTELRALLQERATAELEGVASPATGLQLPPPQHPWCTDEPRQGWWLEHLFGNGHSDTIATWLGGAVAGEAGVGMLRRTSWLRVLCHRVAHDRRQPAMLELLRAVYDEPRRRLALTQADAEFATAFPLQRFGGPWAERLGLMMEGKRRAPFPIGKSQQPKGGRPPDVTVLIPSFRHEAYVETTIRSVLAQRHTAFRLLVVDDGSTDDTVARARSIKDPRLEVRVNASNLGLGNSVLQALADIDTPYVALLNSDDVFHPDRLRRCLEVLAQRPEVMLVTTGMTLIDQQGGELLPANASLVLDGKLVFDWVHWFARVTPPLDLPRERLFATLLEQNWLATSSNLVCRTEWLMRQADSLRSLKYCLDWQLFLEAAATDVLHHLHEPLVAYRLHATNTVWFREGRRWSYYLEVNRVAAAALRAYVSREPAIDDTAAMHLLDAVAGHLLANREVDGFALFIAATTDALQIDRLATTSATARDLVQRLNTTAEQVRAARDEYEVRASDDDRLRTQLRLLLGDIAIEQRGIERGSRRWLEGYCQSLEQRIRECWQGRERIEEEKRSLHDQKAELYADVQGLQRDLETSRRESAHQSQRAAELERQGADLGNQLTTARGDLTNLREALAAVHELRRLIDGELATRRANEQDLERRLLAATERIAAIEQSELESRSMLTAERASVAALTARGEALLADGEALRAEGEALRAEGEALRAEGEALRAELSRRAELLDRRKAEHDELAATLSREQARLEALQQDKSGLEQQRTALTHELARARAELERVGSSREFRAGNFLWNKMPLGYMSRRGKKWYRRLLDAKDRTVMLFKRRRRANGVAVVAACWEWPIYSHTFVYQEMIGLTHMGLDVQMFHWKLGDTGQLHQAFGYLADHRTELQPVWETHLRDREHFEKTRPGRLRAFLEMVAARTGRKVEELEQESLVLQGCTFARMAELAGAKYLHSYFFYDQSFMVMQAAWLLDIPRGVSCYADHMLDDYPFKLVGLHVELASVVVATSARIKKELSQKSGGKFDDKIIVKPNGVDGARFPAVERPQRRPGEPIELISISRIEPKKGLTYLAEAIAMLKQRGHRVVVHVVGSKDQHSKGSLEYAAEFERRIADLGVGQEIVLHGMKKQEELAPLLQRSRAFVAPYVEVENGDKDGIPTAMLEGLASGLPVVTTDSGSILEVVTDDVEGLIVKQRDSRALAAAIERLVQDPVLERRLAKAARARFDREFDIRVTEQRLHERVAGLLRSRPKS
jgi:colanic acid/amylovoran biosynthesis glycosyltransferase